VSEGEKTLDLGKRTEIDSEPNLTALNQMIRLGKLSRTTSYEEKDKLQLRECRIIYKKKSLGDSAKGPGQFAAVASLTPSLYIDPNETMRRQIATELAKANTATKKETDPAVQNASHRSSQ
jgi:hypothetical protein